MSEQITVVSNSAPKPQVEAVKASEVEATETVEQQESVSEENSDETTEESETSETAEAGSEESDESTSESEDETQDDQKEQKPKKQGGYKKRISKLQKELSEREQEIAYLRGLKDQQLEQKKVETKTPQASDQEPNPNDFDTYHEYNKAFVKWELTQAKKAEEAEKTKAKVQSEYQEKLNNYWARMDEFQKSTKDCADVLEELKGINIQDVVNYEILSSDFGPQIAYELAKNRKELERINALAPNEAAKAIAKIEAKIELAQESHKKAKQIITTKAPPPITPVKGTASVVKKTIFTAESQAEYERLRLKKA